MMTRPGPNSRVADRWAAGYSTIFTEKDRAPRVASDGTSFRLLRSTVSDWNYARRSSSCLTASHLQGPKELMTNDFGPPPLSGDHHEITTGKLCEDFFGHYSGHYLVAMDRPQPAYLDDDLEVLHTVVGTMGNNVYVLRCVTSGQAVLVDAAAEPEALLPWAQSLGVAQVLTTHGHHDHIGACPSFRQAGILVLIGAADADRLPGHDRVMNDGDVIQVGNVAIDVTSTPGHTPGSVCFQPRGKPLVFTGDTLFPGGPGATHFPGGDFPTIIGSITTKIFDAMSDGTTILPGHGDSTTVGDERPNLTEWIERGW